MLTPETWLWALSALLIATGVAGTVLPALPGPPLVFAGLLTAAWIHDFERVGAVTLVVLALLTALSITVDLVASVLGAKRVGASGLALAGAALGTIGGLFLGLPGLILGPFIGALAGELIACGSARTAGKVALATWLGMLIGTVLKLALVFTMLGVFALAYLL